MATRSKETFSNPHEEVMPATSDLKSCCCPRRFNPCLVWSSFCSWYLRLLERFFAWYGERIAKHPLITIQVCLVFVSVCSVGFVWFQAESRTVKLFIPQSSKSIEDLDTAEKYFRVKIREEIVLLVASPGHPNVLAPECLKQAFEAHNAVKELESYSDFCVTLSGNKSKSQDECMMINALEFVQFNESKLDGKDLQQVQRELEKAYNSTALMRNGRPFWYNFNRMFGDANREGGSITEAKALQMVYLVHDPSDDETNEKIIDWEKTFIDKVASLVGKLNCFEVHYSSERSLDDAIAESSGSDVSWVAVTFTLMITFACFMLGKFLNPLTGHSLLANAGVFAVALGILAGLGLAMWCRVPFISLVGVLPFLVLGIGIDDMFIMVDELDRQPRDLSKTDTIKAVMKHSGPTVTMTTVTDLLAFAVSTSTSFPAIRYFCIYAALTVTFSFLMIVTFFVAIMSYEVKRIKSGRRDCLPFCFAPQPKEGAPAWDEPRSQTSNRAMKRWAKFLIHPVAKCAVICFSLLLLGAGIYGVTQVEEAFDRRILAKDDTYLKRFLSAQEKHFDVSIPVSIVENGEVDYELSSTQEQIRELTNIVTSNSYFRKELSLSWMNSFSQYGKMSRKNITGPKFLSELKAFLSIPNFAYFNQDLKFSEDGTKLEASRVIGFMKSDGSSTFQKNAMLTLRDDIAEKSKLDAFPITRPFIFFEQYALISTETIRNLIIAGLAVFIITSPFLVDCSVAFLVVLNFAALICELFGLMVIWNVSLNTVSMINLVMAIGFAVDYSAHIAHAYVVSNKLTANERVVEALSTVGASVLMGGFSTFLGMIVLAFAASEIFRIFFRMFFGVVVLGLIHGLCIMPVYLSLMCWRLAVIRPPSVSDSAGKVNDCLSLESIGSVEKVSANDITGSPSSGGCVKGTREPNNALPATQNGEDGKDGEIGIDNKAISTENEKGVGENKQDDTNVNEPDLNKEKAENGEELLDHGSSEGADTYSNDETTAQAPVNKLKQSIPVINSNEDTAHASNDTDANKGEDQAAANKNNEQHPARRVHLQKVPQVSLVGIKQL